jgi:molecular chaperone GrpE
MTEKKKKNDHPEMESPDEFTPKEETHAEHEAEETEKSEEKLSRERHKAKKDKNLERISELESVIAEMADKHLRLQAEFDNFRRRTIKEKTELIKSGGETVLSGILPVMDDFDRALGAMKEVPDEDPAKTGFVLIFNKFRDFMKQNNVKEIESLGADFNVDLHFALTKIPVPSDDMKGKVVDVIEKGYMLNDKVLRYAKVVIGE